MKGEPRLVDAAIAQCWKAAELATAVGMDAMMGAVRQDWHAILRFLKDPYKVEDLLVLVQINPGVVQAAALRGHKEACLTAAKTDGMSLRFVSPEMQDNEEVVQAAVDQTWRALQFASDRLRGNATLVKGTFLQEGCALQFATEALRSDRDVVIYAMTRNEAAFQFAMDSLHRDTTFWEKLTRRFPHGAWKRWLRKGRGAPSPGFN